MRRTLSISTGVITGGLAAALFVAAPALAADPADLPAYGVEAPDAGAAPAGTEPGMPAEPGHEPGMPAEPQHSPPAAADSADAGDAEYVVKKGDTLAEIAESELGSSAEWKRIARANGIDDPKDLREGQKLTIPRS